LLLHPSFQFTHHVIWHCLKPTVRNDSLSFW
jgi:hypothetical protein